MSEEEEEKPIINSYEVRFTTAGEDCIEIEAESEEQAKEIFYEKHAAYDDEVTEVRFRKQLPPEPPYVDPNQIKMDI